MSELYPLRYRMPAVVQCALGQQAQRIEIVADALEEAMDMLAELEWLDTADGARACPWCGCEEDIGHAERCQLGNRLEHWRAS